MWVVKLVALFCSGRGEGESGSVREGGIANLLDPSPRWIRVGRPRRQSEAVRGVVDLE